uniref:Uncharacterized protein n=1 Tax=Arundo donax TaxID=35708 RepID=A0A0A9ABS9_ARUDO
MLYGAVAAISTVGSPGANATQAFASLVLWAPAAGRFPLHGPHWPASPWLKPSSTTFSLRGTSITLQRGS